MLLLAFEKYSWKTHKKNSCRPILSNMFFLMLLEVKIQVFLNSMGTHIQSPSGSSIAMVLGTKKSLSSAPVLNADIYHNMGLNSAKSQVSNYQGDSLN